VSDPSPSISTGAGAPGSDEAPSPERRRRSGRVWAVLAAAAALAGAAVVVAMVAGPGCGASATASDAPDASGLPTAAVERGPMTATITESGEIVAEERQVINNDLRWPAIIKELTPEGTMVETGSVLIRFKCDQLIDAIKQQEIVYRQAVDEHTAALTNLELTRMQTEARVRKAKQAVADAEADLKKYQEAEWPQQWDDAQAAIRLAERDLKLAEHKLESKLKINADPELNKPYSQNEIDAERLTVDRLKLKLKQARTEAEILKEYTHPRAARDCKVAVADAELELLSAKAERDKQVKLAQSALELAEFKRDREKTKLDGYLEDQAEHLTVRAKRPGLVVYETRRRRWQRPITVAVDETISPNQQLMIIPDLNTLVMRTQVYEAIQETVRERIRQGLPARIRLDARRGEAFAGRVTKVADLPDSQNPWLSPGVKVYPTTVAFAGNVAKLGLKPGMTGDVEMMLAELNDVLSVPLAAVFSEGDATFCYRVDDGDRAHRTPVKVGMTSSTRAQVLRGLSTGDRVLLVPPPGTAGRGADREKEEPEEQAGPGGAQTRPAGEPLRARRGPRSRPAGARTGARRRGKP